MFTPPHMAWSVGTTARALVEAWFDQPLLYSVPVIAGSSAVLLSAALGALTHGADGLARGGTRTFFAALVALTILLGRWPDLALAEKNPDESEDIATAWALSADARYPLGADNHTHGPLALASNLLPRLVGWPVDYGSVRLVGLTMSIASCLLLYGILSALFAEPVARVAMAPMALFVAWVRYPDYVAFNAEYPAVLSLLAAGWMVVGLRRGGSRSPALRAAAGGFLIGSVPLVKLQAAPLAASLGVLAIVLLLRSDSGRRRRLGLLIAGSVVPMLLLLAYLVREGAVRHFWTNYIVAGIAFSFVQPAAVFWSFLSERWADEWFVRFFLASAAAGLAASAALAAKGRMRSGAALAASLGLLAVAVFCVYRSGHNYLHYMTLVHYPLALVNGAALGTVVQALTQQPRARAAALALFLAVNGVIPLGQSAKEADTVLGSTLRDDMEGGDVAREVLRYAAPGETLGIWGWAPRYYVLTGMRPATRYAHSGFAMGNPYFFALFLQDFARSRAPVFIDASEAERSEIWLVRYPDLAARIMQDYEEVARVGTAHVYVAKTRLRSGRATRGRARASASGERRAGAR